MSEEQDILLEIIEERRGVYGPPVEEAAKLAKVYSALTGLSITPYHIGLFKAADKLVRLSSSYHKDGTRDLRGYAHYIDEVATNE